MVAPRVEIRLESNQFSCERSQVREVRGREKISSLFEFEIFVASPAGEGLAGSDVTGAMATLVMLEDGFEKRRVHGMIAEVVDMLETESDTETQRLRLVPRMWRLGMVRTQEIYMGLTLRQIIEQKLKQVELDEDVDFALAGADEPREFVVQYDETDLAFVSRLAEHAGISFYFTHDDGGDRVVFTDQPAGFRPIAGAEKASFHARGERLGVFKVDLSTRLVPAMCAVYDYNYMTPMVEIASVCELAGGYAGGVLEYASNVGTPEQAKALARVRAEEHGWQAQVITGEADLSTLAAGARVTLSGHPRIDDLELLVIEVEHRASQVVMASGGADDGPAYHATFQAIPAKVPFRPRRVTPKPRLHGVTPGIVQAAPKIESEQPWIDEHGRYLVQMLFDTAATGERKASLPIRMAQPHAGPGYGIHFPLRPGTEVLVAFVNGDPDRPVIVGSVPNAITPTPVVDRDATQHRIKTRSGVLIEIDDGR